MKRLLALGLAFAGMLLLLFCSAAFADDDETVEILTIADSTGDWGFPSPYAHYSRGPGYVRMSLIFDTLIWKDENGFVPALAEKWEHLPDENACLLNQKKDKSRICRSFSRSKMRSSNSTSDHDHNNHTILK